MSRKQLIFPSLLVLTSAFAVAVQRDTFVRRWLLPEPIADAKLRQVLPVFEVKGATFEQALAKLATQAGVAIRASPAVSENVNVNEDILFEMTLRDATTSEIVDALIRQCTPSFIQIVAVGRDNEIILMTATEAEDDVCIRSYDISHLLPPPGTWPAASPDAPMGLFAGSGGTLAPLDERQKAINNVLFVTAMALSESEGRGMGASNIYGWAGRVVVTTSRMRQQDVERLVRNMDDPKKH